MLTPIEQVLSKDEVRQFRTQLDDAGWESGRSTAGTLAGTVKHNQQLADGSAIATQLGNHILRRLGSLPEFISAALPHRIYPPKFNRYRDGGAYGMHVDSALMQVPGTDVTVRTDLSATLFLSEPDEYEGGELQIETAVGVQSIKLAAGDLILYPSDTLHQVTPVTRGSRIASFFWVQSMVQDQGERSLLYDLDQAIQALTLQGSRGPELLRLTGIYHNLLRRWAVS